MGHSGPGSNGNEEYSTFPKAPGLRLHHQMQNWAISRTLVRGKNSIRFIVQCFVGCLRHWATNPALTLLHIVGWCCRGRRTPRSKPEVFGTFQTFGSGISLWSKSKAKNQIRNIKKVLKKQKKQTDFLFVKFSSYNVWKHVRYPALISHQPGVIKQFR